jgi:hypothetical protein
MEQTVGQLIKWDFKANGALEIKDKNGRRRYYEESKNGEWSKFEYDGKGNRIHYCNSNGFWEKREWDSQGNLIYVGNSNGYWEKWEYDLEGNKIYWETSDGEIVDNRPKQCLDKEKDLLEERCKYVLKYLFRDYENTMTAKQYNNAMLALRSIALGNPLLKNQ